MPLNSVEKQNFYKSVLDLVCSKPVQEMKKYRQHGGISTYHHCLNVAYYSYWLSLRFFKKANARSVARGAILHDMFLYDWHKAERKTHVVYHPEIALYNSRFYFELNQIEEDAILSHMWPLKPHKRPQFKESMIVCVVDTYCAIIEWMGRSKYSEDIDILVPSFV